MTLEKNVSVTGGLLLGFGATKVYSFEVYFLIEILSYFMQFCAKFSWPTFGLPLSRSAIVCVLYVEQI